MGRKRVHPGEPWSPDFIELVKGLPTIWQKGSNDYSNKRLRQQAWKDLSTHFKITELEAEKHWKALKSDWVKERNILRDTPSGSGATLSSSWNLYDQLAFLHEAVTQRKSKKNGNAPPSSNLEFGDEEPQSEEDEITEEVTTQVNQSSDDDDDTLEESLSNLVGETVKMNSSGVYQVISSSSSNTESLPATNSSQMKANNRTPKEPEKGSKNKKRKISTRMSSDENEENSTGVLSGLYQQIEKRTNTIMASLKVEADDSPAHHYAAIIKSLIAKLPEEEQHTECNNIIFGLQLKLKELKM